MALDVSSIVSAVNKYLYSISDTAKAASDNSDATKTSSDSIFKKYLDYAVDNDTTTSESDATDTTEAAEAIAAAAADSSTSSTAQTTTSDDTLASEINSVFDNLDLESEILNNITSNTVDVQSEITRNIASHTVDVKAEILDNIALHSRSDEFQMAAVAATDSSSTATDGDNTSNSDAYNGLLGASALKELADSSYFTANLIQSSIITDTDEDSSSNSETMPLSDLNNNSLFANTLGESYSSLTSSDYTAALLNAYKNNDISSSLLDFTV